MTIARRTLGVVALAGTVALLATACASTSDTPAADSDFEPVQVDVGTGTITVDKPIENIALIVGGSKKYSSNVGYMEGAQKAADAAGVNLDILEPDFDPSAQYQMLQTAMSSGKYDAIAIQAVDSSLCSTVGEDALEYQILVTGFVNELCAGEPGPDTDQLRAPGTVAYVGGQNTFNDHVTWLEEVLAENPGPQKAVVVLGPDGNAGVLNFQAAFDKVMAENPDLEVVGYVYTDYSTPDAYAKVGPALQGNPDATIVLSHYVDLSVGAAAAIESLGLDIPVWETGGGSEVSVGLLDEGKVQGTWPLLPQSSGEAAINALLDAAAGKEVPAFISGNGDQTLSLILPGDLSSFTPQW